MKKKGLIVATIVMVLVLAVSLTTATYAWFTVTDVTTIDAFEISVVAGNAVNVGVKQNNTYAATVTANDFRNGAVTYTPGNAGTIGGGTWDGATGLGSRIDHDIAWGAQSAAVGITGDVLTDATGGYWTGATDANTGFWNLKDKAGSDLTEGSQSFTVIAANAPTQEAPTALTGVTKAMANKNGVRYTGQVDDDSKVGDYAYLYIGASPTKALTSNQLVIMLEADQDAGAIVGILSSIHVAYRLNGGTGATGNTPGTWTDVELCGDGIHYDELLQNVTLEYTSAEAAAVKNAYEQSYSGKTAPTTGAWYITIDGLTTTQGEIDQIEIVIYIAGADSDCRDEAKGAEGSISIFFVTEEQTA
ncbi:MAG: hypothetical protein IJY49_01790 [Clostridia bacterium]|nr:hypothetical protein [Clostridia bacterium]